VKTKQKHVNNNLLKLRVATTKIERDTNKRPAMTLQQIAVGFGPDLD
jgi:hypothetical protein